MNIKRSLVFFCLFAVLSAVSYAGGSSNTDLGNQYYKQFEFKKAVACYLKALKHDKKSSSLVQHIANCYRLMNDWPSAKPYYAKLVNRAKVNPQNYIYYAQALREGKDYQQAKIYYAKYLDLFPDDSSVREQMIWIDHTQELLTSNVTWEIKNMRQINTPFSEFGVTFFGLNEVYFCSNRKPDHYVKRIDNWTNNPFLKIYAADVADSLGNLKNVSMLPSSIVNKKYHDASPCYNARLDELYFDQSNYNGNRAFYSADKTVKLKIYKVAYLPDAEKWDGELKEAVPFNSREYSVCHPSLNKRGDTLYFTSDMPGGYGRADVYLSVRQHDGEWGPPVNLGPGINTSGDDMFPFIADDGTLYFASNGHLGLGGLDIFSSRLEKGAWSPARNLGAPINSNLDDFGFVIRSDNNSGYLCSNRPGGMGDDDIYSFRHIGATITGITYNAYTGDSVGGVNVEVRPDLEAPKFMTGTDGSFSINAPSNVDYTFTANKEGYHEAKLSYRVTDSTRYVRIPMYPEGDIKLSVSVIDKKTRQPIEAAELKFSDISHDTHKDCLTAKDGSYLFTLDTNSRYKIEAYKETGDPKEKYLKVSADISTKGVYPPTTLKQVIELDKVKKVVPIRIDNIYYDLDRWFIRKDAEIELNKLVKILLDNPTMEIELSSHTDCRGTAAYNMILSAKRAQAVVDYIVSQGISAKRMTARGYGESKLVNHCECEGTFEVPCTEEQHQQNRRTEFKIIKF